MLSRVPRWIWWTAGIVVLWVLWAVLIQAPMQRASYELEPREAKVAREIQSIDARMAAVPAVMARLDSARAAIGRRLDSYGSVDRVEHLMRELTSEGVSRGLEGVRVRPDLEHLLRITSPDHADGDGPHIDTIPITIAAQGRFAAIGSWMEELERRPDFRVWHYGQWTSSDEGLTAVELRGAFMVVNRTGLPARASTTAEVPQ